MNRHAFPSDMVNRTRGDRYLNTMTPSRRPSTRSPDCYLLDGHGRRRGSAEPTALRSSSQKRRRHSNSTYNGRSSRYGNMTIGRPCAGQTIFRGNWACASLGHYCHGGKVTSITRILSRGYNASSVWTGNSSSYRNMGGTRCAYIRPTNQGSI